MTSCGTPDLSQGQAQTAELLNNIERLKGDAYITQGTCRYFEPHQPGSAIQLVPTPTRRAGWFLASGSHSSLVSMPSPTRSSSDFSFQFAQQPSRQQDDTASTGATFQASADAASQQVNTSAATCLVHCDCCCHLIMLWMVQQLCWCVHGIVEAF